MTKFSSKGSILEPNSSDLPLNMFKPVMHEQLLKSSSQSLRIFIVATAGSYKHYNNLSQNATWPSQNPKEKLTLTQPTPQ